MSDHLTLQSMLNQAEQDRRRDVEIINNASIWLFLSTLGVWSVDHFSFQIAACLVIFALFMKRLIPKRPKGHSLRDQIDDIIKSISESEMPASAKTLMTEEANNLKNDLGSTRSMLTMGWPYLVSFIFFFASALEFSGAFTFLLS